ncbi:MAG: class I SAM-dependent methyltransferase, partial [Proteobacteria bacterium]
YLARARMLLGHVKPSRWLDVGGGHGHFCLLARDVFPDAAFDGLDLSSSVLEAEKKGWTNRSYRGLFPDLAEQISQSELYDVVSMSHYLEHTRDPALEIEAAGKVLPKGGHLLIELPDPESRFGKIFGSFWIPWFQPQHQHFLSAANLQRILQANNFEPVSWQRGEAHHPIDIMFSLGLMVTQIARPLDLPWLPTKSGWMRKLFNQIVFIVAIPFLIISRILDLALAPLLRRPGWANAYRVLAIRVA